MKIIEKYDKSYPKMLLNIYNPPERLYVLGNEQILNNFSIAMVGSRKCTKYGAEIAKSLAYNLSKRGITVVSGMAKGIDAFSHIGTIMGKGKTIAVLGSGFDHIYPEENKKLMLEIIKNDGAIITEYERNIKPIAENFPNRNRIISGISHGVVVVEAAERSGSLITADIALESGKEVFAVPGNINSITSKGTNELIKDGAKLVENVNDILDEYKKINN